MVKPLKILFTMVFSIVFISCNSNTNKQEFYGTYTFDKVSYLSPLSSSTTDYLNKQMTGTKYMITEDLFKIESLNNIIEVRSPKFIKEELPQNSDSLLDARTIDGIKVKSQYSIFEKNGDKTHWRLYISSDYIWVSSYVDNTANGQEI